MKTKSTMRQLRRTHATIFALQAEMKQDKEFKALCENNGLPWNFKSGYEPRWYNGPAPEKVKVLVLMAEPGAITRTEAPKLANAIQHVDWIGDRSLLHLQEHYWRANLCELCGNIWPGHTDLTERNMYKYLGGSCSFWMSPHPDWPQAKAIPAEPVNYFLKKYLPRFLAFFPSAVILAAGGKAAARLKKARVKFERCHALTRPASNKPASRESWGVAGRKIRKMLER